MATSWISFGPDLEPMESEVRGAAGRASPRRDGLSVIGSGEEVVSQLAEAAGVGNGWCALVERLQDGDERTVYVNAAAVRLVVDEP